MAYPADLIIVFFFVGTIWFMVNLMWIYWFISTYWRPVHIAEIVVAIWNKARVSIREINDAVGLEWICPSYTLIYLSKHYNKKSILTVVDLIIHKRGMTPH